MTQTSEPAAPVFKFVAVAVHLQQPSRTGTVFCMTQTVKVDSTEAAAVQEAIDFALESKPDFAVCQYLVSCVE